jgi:hypothetical protein
MDNVYHHHQNTEVKLLRMGFPKQTNSTEYNAHRPLARIEGHSKISAITGPSSPRSDKLEAETVVRARIYPEDSTIKRGGSSETLILTTGMNLGA